MSSRRLRSAGAVSILLVCGAVAVRAQSWAWEPGPSLPETQGRTFCVAANWFGAIWVVGGRPFGGDSGGGAVDYLPIGTDTWLAGTSLNGPYLGIGAGIDWRSRLVIFGGRSVLDGSAGPAYVYAPGGEGGGPIAARSPQAPPTGFALATDATLHIYSIGGGLGALASPAQPNSKFVERYDGGDDTWQPVAPLPAAVANAAAVYDARGHILVFGGFNELGTARLASVMLYDVASDAWSTTAVPDMPVALSNEQAVLGADDRIYVLGGLSGAVSAPTISNAVYRLNLDTNTWAAGPSLLTGRETFAATRGDDNFIYALGGNTASGGTNLVERLDASICPIITAQPPSAEPSWVGQTSVFTVQATGVGLTYQWRRDGVNLADGTTPEGTVITGSTTPMMVLAPMHAGDAGIYDVELTNACESMPNNGTEVVMHSASAPVAPRTSGVWNPTDLNPAIAVGSEALGVFGSYQVGYQNASGTSNPPHAVRWAGTAASATPLLPASTRDAAYGIRGDEIVGIWTWTHAVGRYQFAHDQHASLWQVSTGAHTELQPAGWKYGAANGTDGAHQVGYVSVNDATGATSGHAALWSGSPDTFVDLHPAGARNSSATGVDHDRQYGWAYLSDTTVHAAVWAGSPLTYLDLNPSSASNSHIYGAHDFQQVGDASIGGVTHAGLWSETVGSFVDLHPSGATASQALGVGGGLQVGVVTVNGQSHAALWSGSAGSFVDLHPFAGAAFSSSTAAAVDVDAVGRVTVVGYGQNTTTNRVEAITWVLPHRGDTNCDGVVDFADINPFVLALSSPIAYQTQYPNCPMANADCNGDGVVDFADINPFVTLLSGQ